MADIWPSSPIVVTDPVKQIITRFFNISDSLDPNSGKSFADELFVEDGFFKTHKTMIFKGREEIAGSRSKLSPIIKYRKHFLNGVYATNSPATDLVVLGRFEIGYKDGSVLELDFTARFVLTDYKGDEVKVKHAEFWSDGGETKEAFEKASKALAEKE